MTGTGFLPMVNTAYDPARRADRLAMVSVGVDRVRNGNVDRVGNPGKSRVSSRRGLAQLCRRWPSAGRVDSWSALVDNLQGTDPP